MQSLNLGALARAAKAHIQGGGLPAEIQAVGTDSRSLPSGSLFVALRGERFDGHDYLEQAASAGAVAAMVDSRGTPKESPIPLLVVEDTLTGLGAIARYVRDLHSGPTVGVTGSNGKTTTKELIGAALSPRGPVHKTRGNLNNRIGVPLTLFDWTDEWAAVVEMGMNEFGEIYDLAKMARPAVGVITVVGPAHIENLGSLENIARAKGELFEALDSDAVAVVNADDPLITTVSGGLLRGQPVLRFGRGEGADIRLLSAESDGEGVRVEFNARGERLQSRLPFPGLHNAMNAAAAIACAVALDVPAADAAAGLEQTVLPGSRLVVRAGLGPGVTVLDDSYNANPQSMDAAFETLASLAKGRRVAALGDMLELGERAQQLHYQTGQHAADSGIEWVLALGEFAESTAAGARDRGARGDAFSNMKDLTASLSADLEREDWLLVKGSRGMRMERVVAHLEETR